MKVTGAKMRNLTTLGAVCYCCRYSVPRDVPVLWLSVIAGQMLEVKKKSLL